MDFCSFEWGCLLLFFVLFLLRLLFFEMGRAARVGTFFTVAYEGKGMKKLGKFQIR